MFFCQIKAMKIFVNRVVHINVDNVKHAFPQIKTSSKAQNKQYIVLQKRRKPTIMYSVKHAKKMKNRSFTFSQCLLLILPSEK